MPVFDCSKLSMEESAALAQSVMDKTIDFHEKDVQEILALYRGISEGAAYDISYLRTRSRWSTTLERRLVKRHRLGLPVMISDWPGHEDGKYDPYTGNPLSGEDLQKEEKLHLLRVLFLDIDGVLNSVRSALAYGKFPMYAKDQEFDWVAVKMVQRLCEELELSVVLSSTWRFHEDWLELKDSLSLPIVDRTPRLSKMRGDEIKAWLNSNEGKVDKYVILDDDLDMLPEQLPNFVHVDGRMGLSVHDYNKVRVIIQGRPE